MSPQGHQASLLSIHLSLIGSHRVWCSTKNPTRDPGCSAQSSQGTVWSLTSNTQHEAHPRETETIRKANSSVLLCSRCSVNACILTNSGKRQHPNARQHRTDRRSKNKQHGGALNAKKIYSVTQKRQDSQHLSHPHPQSATEIDN
mmetsp:Transcript_13927/g.33137  ORF Transcript_13927/g.33137 Transcript_13927/m.33137 type:complete len:145 (+) Transcript_13927:1432-1866(+)